MPQEFVRREEFSAEVKGLREDFKEASRDLSRLVETSLQRVTTELRAVEAGWREHSDGLAEKVGMIKLSQGIADQQIKALETHPQIDSIRSSVDRGFNEVNQRLGGVNDRLDRVNGRLNKHGEAIAELRSQYNGNRRDIDGVAVRVRTTEGRVNQMIGSGGMVAVSRKAKIAVGTGAGIGGLAVLHSLFEMLKSVGPQVVSIVGAVLGHPIK